MKSCSRGWFIKVTFLAGWQEGPLEGSLENLKCVCYGGLMPDPCYRKTGGGSVAPCREEFPIFSVVFLFFKILFIYFLESRREGERGREKSMCERYINWLPLTCPQLGNRVCNPGMCPDWGVEPATFWVAGQHSIH